MCGRTCCTLAPCVVPLACTAVTPRGVAPTWTTKNSSYRPSTNVPPTRVTPILVREHKLEDGGGGGRPKEADYRVQPMLWGFIPPWHRGEEPTKHGYTTNNARIEGVVESKLYRGAVARGQRCVVICDGFYEWKAPDSKKGGPKQPYLVYAAQEEGRDVLAMSECTAENSYSEQNGWIGPKPLFMAGIFSIWHKPEDSEESASAKKEKKNKGDDDTEEEDGGPVVYSYSVITREANPVTRWLHDRVPAILPDAESVQRWLDVEVDAEEAIENLEPIKEGQLSWHAVTRDVGSVRNQDDDLNKPVDPEKEAKANAKGATLMSNWLKRGAAQKKEGGQPPEKKRSK